MTAQERAAIRTSLVRATLGATGTTPKARPSPYMNASPLGTFSMFARAFVFVVVGFIVGGTSLTFAGRQALPGDTLYAIKTNVIEKMDGALAFSTEARARVEARHVATRVSEISSLKARGVLNDPVVASSATRALEASIASYTTKVTQLQNEGRVARSQEIATATLATLETVAPTRPVVAPTLAKAKQATQPEVATMMATFGTETTVGTAITSDMPTTTLDIALMNAVSEVSLIKEQSRNPSVETVEIEEPATLEVSPAVQSISNDPVKPVVPTPLPTDPRQIKLEASTSLKTN